MKNKKKKLLAIALTGLMILSACGKKEEAKTDNKAQLNTQATEKKAEAPKPKEEPTSKIVEQASTVSELKQKYCVDNSKYIKPFYNVEQNTQFTFHFNSKVEPIKAITVHTDPSCNIDSTIYQINSAYLNGDGSGYNIVVKPGSPVLNSSARKEGELSKYNWGNAPVYYLSINYDMSADTPTKLDSPIVVPFTVRRKISTPNIEAHITKDGSFTLSWKPVKNAVKYNIYSADNVKSSSQAVNMSRSQAGYAGDHIQLLATVDSSKTIFDDFNKDNNGNTITTSKGAVNTQNFHTLGAYYVTAIDASGNESSFSMAVEGWKYGSQLPNKFDESGYISKGKDGKANYLPNTVPVQMIDKSIHYYPINYTKINEYTAGYATYGYRIVGTKLTGKIDVYKKDKIYAPSIQSTSTLSNDLYIVKNDINIIPDVDVNTINDTAYSNSIISLDKEVNRDESTAIKYNQEALHKRADIESERIVNDGVYTTQEGPLAMLEYDSLENSGNTETKAENNTENKTDENVTSTPTSTSTSTEKAQSNDIPSEITSENLVDEQIKSTKRQIAEADTAEIPAINVKYFADSAEEEYLARNMIAANNEISLEAFPNLQNTEYLSDVLMKVVYQNPYIIGFNNARYDNNTMTLYIDYQFDANTIHSKQSSVSSEATNIVKSTITSDMSDEEKVMALWKYLEEHTEYDKDASKHVEQNNFKDITGFEDAFDSYGIMCKKVGVSQSYSYCYKLLLSLCDVPCITLTGYIDQTLPHAWNAIYLNGAWRWTDVTNNNTNSGIPYMLYQTSSEYAEKSNYVPDELYEINTKLNAVSSTDNSMDWYVENNCYTKSQSELIQLVVNNFNNSDKYVCVKSEYAPVFDDTFMQSLGKSLNDNGVSTEDIYNIRMGYLNGIFILAKQQ